MAWCTPIPALSPLLNTADYILNTDLNDHRFQHVIRTLNPGSTIAKAMADKQASDDREDHLLLSNMRCLEPMRNYAISLIQIMRFTVFLLLSFFLSTPAIATPLFIGFSCESQLEKIIRPSLPSGVVVIVETPRLVVVTPQDAGNAQVFGIYERATGVFVGTMTYHHRGNKVGQVKLSFFEFARGLGYEMEAQFAMMLRAFEQDKVQLIRADIASENIASLSRHLELGFQKHSSGQWYALHKTFSSVKNKVTDVFKGDLGAFSRPSVERSWAQKMAHEFVQAAFEFDRMWALNELILRSHVLNKEKMSEAEIRWVKKFIEASPELQEEAFRLVPASYKKYLYESFRKMFEGGLSWNGWNSERVDLISKLQLTLLHLERIKD